MIAKQQFQNFWNSHRNSELAQNNNSRISGTATESRYHRKHRFQNFRNCHRISVSSQTPIPEFPELPQKFCMIAKPNSRICGIATESRYHRKQPIPEYLELKQNFCMIANPDSRISGTATESRYHQNFYIISNTESSSISGTTTEILYDSKTTIPEFLEMPKNFYIISNTESRIPGTTTDFLFDRKHRFQTFWNCQKYSV
jgi:hypothetical protein